MTFADGSEAVRVSASATFDHAYIAYYARTGVPARSAYLGFGGNASADLSVVNQLAGGTITLTAAGTTVITNNAAVGGALTVAGNTAWHAGNLVPGATMPVRTVTANYTVVLSDGVIFVDASAGPVTITLPLASSAIVNGQGQRVRVKKIDTTANAVTISATGGLIDLAANAVISYSQNAFEFNPIPSSTNWGGF